MLILSRKVGEEIIIDGHIRLMVIEVRGTRVKLGFTARREVAIHRSETQAAIDQQTEEPPP